MDCGPTTLLCPWDFPNKNAGVGCHFLLQGIFLTQELNPALPQRRQILYRLRHLGAEASEPDMTLLDKFNHPSMAGFLRHF